MRKEEAIDLIDSLSGDEHSWVDFKEDYDIGGIPRDNAEFVKDISSMANTISDKSEHYILVGVNDDGNLVGINKSRKNYRGNGPRHIFSYDENSIQQKIDSNLSPAPKVEWNTFEEGGQSFGVLTIRPLEDPPSVTIQHIDQNNTRHLHKGITYVRKGSGKKIAGREEYQNIIEYRIGKQRERILEGVNKAVQIGPEWIERLSDALPDDSGIPISGTSDASEADIEVTQRLTREPASNLDQQLNEDIAQWEYRGDDYVEAKPLWQYYSEPNILTLDLTAVTFLTRASLKNFVLGGFWLIEADEEDWSNVILQDSLGHHRAERAASLTLLLDDRDMFDRLMELSKTNAEYGYLSKCESKFGNTISDRVNFVMEDRRYELNHGAWREHFDARDQDVDDIKQMVPELAQHLEDIQGNLNEMPSLGGTLEDFRNALWDLEAVYVGRIAGGYKDS